MSAETLTDEEEVRVRDAVRRLARPAERQDASLLWLLAWPFIVGTWACYGCLVYLVISGLGWFGSATVVVVTVPLIVAVLLWPRRILVYIVAALWFGGRKCQPSQKSRVASSGPPRARSG